MAQAAAELVMCEREVIDGQLHEEGLPTLVPKERARREAAALLERR
jgi:hypothetical protein